MYIYRTYFKLVEPVIDLNEAREYLTEDDMDDDDCPLGGYFDEFGRWVDDPDFMGYDIFPRPRKSQ